MCNECGDIMNAIFATQLQKKAESRGAGGGGNGFCLMKHGHVINAIFSKKVATLLTLQDVCM